MTDAFAFISPGRLVDDDLELFLVETTPADPHKGYVPQYEFEMRRADSSTVVGTIRLRIGDSVTLKYAGNIGYEVHEPHRGHKYAARSCSLILPLARLHGLNAVWLTVDPKNVPSQRTCQAIGARYMGTVRIPKTDNAYQEGARYRRRFKLDLIEQPP
jgi:predicted acetyltransferase